MKYIASLLACFALAACSKGGDAMKEQIQGQAALGNAKGSDAPACKVYSQDEASVWVGAKVRPPELATGGCQWAIGDGSGSMMLTIVEARYHERPTRQAGYHELKDIPGQAFVAPFMDGWLAGAIVGTDAVRVTLSGPGVTEEKTVALLKDAIKRHG